MIVSIETHEILLQVDPSFQPLYPLIFELSALVHPQCGSPSSPPRGDALETDYNLKSPSHQLCRVSVIMLEFKVQKFNESASASASPSPEGCMKLFGIKITTIYATMKNVNIKLMSVESVADTWMERNIASPFTAWTSLVLSSLIIDNYMHDEHQYLHLRIITLSAAANNKSYNVTYRFLQTLHNEWLSDNL